MDSLDFTAPFPEKTMPPESQIAERLAVLVVAADTPRESRIRYQLHVRGHEVRTVAPESVLLASRVGTFDAAVVLGDATASWLTSVRALRAGGPSASVLILEDADPRGFDRAIAAGVSEILLEPVPDAELERALRSAAAITRRWRRALRSLGGVACRAAAIPHFDVDGCLDRLSRRGELTGRERDVLRAMLCGKRIDEIAHSLHISENTVKFHVRNVLRKLDLRSRSELLRLLVE